MASILMSILTTRPIEDLVGWSLYNRRGRDAGLIKSSPIVTKTHPTPTITVSAPDIGPSGTAMPKEYGNVTIGGRDKIPTIAWSAPDSLRPQIKQWLLLCEDADVPLAEPIVHGIYYGISPDKTRVTEDDFTKTAEDNNMLRGGFEYGANRQKIVYVFPRPIARHGSHRYFWTVVGLSEKVNFEKGAEGVGKDEVLKGIDGKIVGWGDWYGTYERKL